MNEPTGPHVVVPSNANAPTNAPAATFSPSQVIADNISTRVREIFALACYVLLARWGIIPGAWAAGLIALTVLPIEITRQLVKPMTARAISNTTTGGGAAMLFVAFIYKSHAILTTAPVVVATVAAMSPL